MSDWPSPLWLVPDYFSEILIDDPVVAVELLEVYLEDAESRVRELRQCLLIDDAGAVGAITHNMIGSARQFGALRLATLAELVETAVRNGDWDAARGHLNTAADTFELLNVDVKRMIASIVVNNPPI